MTVSCPSEGGSLPSALLHPVPAHIDLYSWIPCPLLSLMCSSPLTISQPFQRPYDAGKPFPEASPAPLLRGKGSCCGDVTTTLAEGGLELI